jgi:hypothetical protein
MTKKSLSGKILLSKGINFSVHVLFVAFLACTIVYINKIHNYKVVDKGVPQKVKSLYRPLQMFVYVMAWILLIVMGLWAIKKTNIF